MDQRQRDLITWLDQRGYLVSSSLTPASKDASFRRYYRLPRGRETVIVMDAPPPQEDAGRFVRLATWFREHGMRTPEILDADEERGFVVLEDFGNTQFFQALFPLSAGNMYQQAMDALLGMQGSVSLKDDSVAAALPEYDHAFIMREMGLFDEWLLGRHLNLSDVDQEVLLWAYSVLAKSALEQPQVVVHRDYHSRNLMVLDEGGPGVLDFQDAVRGPITYDLVSLLKDCYVEWPVKQVRRWALTYFDQAKKAGLLAEEVDEARFLRWFDLMGAQRHLKAAGIFARLLHRDGRDEYLRDIPLTLGYVAQVCARYEELNALGELLDNYVQPTISLRIPKED